MNGNRLSDWWSYVSEYTKKNKRINFLNLNPLYGTKYSNYIKILYRYYLKTLNTLADWWVQCMITNMIII